MSAWLLTACAFGACSSPAADGPDIGVAMSALDQLLAATPATGRTPGTNQAIAQLVQSQFQQAGVTDVTIEAFAIPVSTATDHSLSVTSPTAIAGARDHSVNVFGGAGQVTSASLIDEGLANQPDPNAAGKVALIDFSVTRSLRSQYRNVVASGAVGAIIDAKIDTLRQRNVWTLAGASAIEGPIPVVTVAEADATAARAQMTAGMDVKVSLGTNAAVAPQMAYNVIARIPGTTHPERTLVVNGHLDSWFTGAADDGQAVAGLVALAKLFAAHPLPYTLELVAFDCEETFLLGSNNYVTRRLPGARDSLIGAISLEMLAPKTRELAVVTVDGAPAWTAAIQAGGLTDAFPVTLSAADQMTAFGGEIPSDQGTFWSFGIPGFMLVTTYNEYHTTRDDSSNTDQARFATVLDALANTMRALGADSPDALGTRPASSLALVPTLGAPSAQGLTGSLVATNAQTAASVADATITVTLYDGAYTQVLAAAPVTYDATSGYTFSLTYPFVSATSYTLSIDATQADKASGRAVVHL